MPFMERQVWPSVFVDVEYGRGGREPFDVAECGGYCAIGGDTLLNGCIVLSRRDAARLRVRVALYLCVDPSEIDVSTLRRGWGAMLAAPGYLDRSDMSVHATEADAEELLTETYPESEDEID